MSAGQTPPALACELIKAARSEWLTRAEIAERVGVHINTIDNWLPEFVAYGILQRRLRAKARSAWLKRPVEYSLAPEWGGQGFGSPQCVVAEGVASVGQDT